MTSSFCICNDYNLKRKIKKKKKNIPMKNCKSNVIIYYYFHKYKTNTISILLC